MTGKPVIRLRRNLCYEKKALWVKPYDPGKLWCTRGPHPSALSRRGRLLRCPAAAGSTSEVSAGIEPQRRSISDGPDGVTQVKAASIGVCQVHGPDCRPARGRSAEGRDTGPRSPSPGIFGCTPALPGARRTGQAILAGSAGLCVTGFFAASGCKGESLAAGSGAAEAPGLRRVIPYQPER